MSIAMFAGIGLRRGLIDDDVSAYRPSAANRSILETRGDYRAGVARERES